MAKAFSDRGSRSTKPHFAPPRNPNGRPPGRPAGAMTRRWISTTNFARGCAASRVISRYPSTFRALIGRRERRPDHLLDAGRAGHQHDETIETECAAAGLRHLPQRGKEILVDRIAVAVAPFLLGHLGLETPALLHRIGQFAERIGELDTAHIELEAFRNARIGALAAGERRLDGRILGEDRGAPDAEPRLDLFHQDAAEDVAPVVVRGAADAGRRSLPRQR